MKLLSISILIFSFFLFISCASFTPFSDGSDFGSVSEEIGPDGGTVTTPDGRLTLSIPAGALRNTETITIEELELSDLPDEYQDMKAVYDFGPEGLTFSRPATVLFSDVHDPSPFYSNTPAIPIAVIGNVRENQSNAEILANIEIRESPLSEALHIQGELNHFSKVFIDFRHYWLTLEAEKNELEVGERTTVRSVIRFDPNFGLEDEDIRFVNVAFFGGLNLISDFEFSEARYTDLTAENGIRLQPVEIPIVDSPYYKLTETPKESFDKFINNVSEINAEHYYVNAFEYTCIEAGSPGKESLRAKIDIEHIHPAFDDPRIISIYFGENTENTIIVSCLSDDEEEEEVANDERPILPDQTIDYKPKWRFGGGIGLTTTGSFDDPVRNQPGILDTQLDGSSIQFNVFGERGIDRIPFNLELPGNYSVGADFSYRRINSGQMWVSGNGQPDHTDVQVDIWTLGFYTSINNFIMFQLWKKKFIPVIRVGGGIIWNNGKFNLYLPDGRRETHSRMHKTAFPMIGVGTDITLTELFALRLFANSVFGVGADNHLGLSLGLNYNIK